MSSAVLRARNGGSPEARSAQEAAERVGVAATTLRRWLRDGLIPPYGSWSPASVSHARIVARLRERGHSLQDIRLLRYVSTVLEAGLPLVAASAPAGVRAGDGASGRRRGEVARSPCARAADPRGRHWPGELEFDKIAEIRLKGFTESTEVFVAAPGNGR